MKVKVYDPRLGKGRAHLVQRLTNQEIPICHVRPPELAPAACIRITQDEMSADRSLADRSVTYIVDASGAVQVAGGVASSLPLATSVYLLDKPCYYRHRLQYPIQLGGQVQCWHPDVPVEIVGSAYRLVAVPTGGGRHFIDIYMPEAVSGAYALYQAVVDGVEVTHRENVYPIPSSRIAAIEEVIAAAPTDPVIAVEAITPTRTRIYVPVRASADERDRLTIQWRLEVWDGFVQKRTEAWQAVTLLPAEQSTAADGDRDGWQIVAANPLSLLTTSLGTTEYIKVGINGTSNVQIDAHPDGATAVRLRWISGLRPLDLPDRFLLTGGAFTPQVAVTAPDDQMPRVSVSGQSLRDPWHIRVQLGRTTRTVGNVPYLYALPEYLQDRFNPIPPYAAQEERPLRIDDHTFRVSQTPIDLDIPVTAVIAGETTITLTITEIDSEYGVVRIAESIPETAPLQITYAHRKDYVTYRGSQGNYLDLNPRSLSHIQLAHTRSLDYARRLTSTSLYLYWLPYATLNGGGEQPIRQETLIHTINPLTDPTAILLATLEMTIPFGPSSLRILDARRRGGGLPRALRIPDSIQQETGSYADVGTYDGREVVLSGSYVVEAAPWLGIADPGQLREMAERVGIFGQLPLVRAANLPTQIVAGPDSLIVDVVEVS